MGNIVKLFHRSTTDQKRPFATSLYIDICENIHLHYRDLRMEFSEKEFVEFMGHCRKMGTLFDEWRAAHPEWKESAPETFHNREITWVGDYKPQADRLAQKSAYWDNRISLEENEGGVYHIHWRNYRFEMNRKDFAIWMQAFKDVGINFYTSSIFGRGKRLLGRVLKRLQGKQS